jgi:GntR family transcriptional regulator
VSPLQEEGFDRESDVTHQQSKLVILIDPSSGVPVYRQLMDQIRFLIASGVLAPGDPVPSTRTLSSELGVNPMTISKAYSYLERDGVLERRPGQPLVVKSFGPSQLKHRKVEQLEEDLLSAVKIVNQLGIEPDEAIRVFTEMLEKGQPPTRREEDSNERD